MLKNYSAQILNKLIRVIAACVTKQHKKRILIIKESASGSNTYALWKFANTAIRGKFEIILYKDNPALSFVNSFKKYALIYSARMIITTHASYKPTKKHINFHLWHGASIKKLGVMENSNEKRFQLPWQKIDYIMSYSETYTTFLNACMVTDPKKYLITGAPRNDFLYASNGRENIKAIYKKEIQEQQLIFYFPTFRDYYGTKQGDRNYENLFGFDEFSINKFDKFLDENNLKLIFKPHPHEESLVLKYFNGYPLKNLLVLSDSILEENLFDLYELLNAADMVITDYSSIYDDYLLLDRPVLFAPVDLDSYVKGRGFLVESFSDWVPGPKVYNQMAMQSEIIKLLSDPDYYFCERNKMKQLQHRFKDGDSSMRVWDCINKILSA